MFKKLMTCGGNPQRPFMLYTRAASSVCGWRKHRTGSRVSLRILRLCHV
jgi:hypothetical protein